jgi:hypothetical protein
VPNASSAPIRIGIEKRPSRSEVSSPTVPVRWVTRPWASVLGENASWVAACRTRARVEARTWGCPLRAFDAVATDTPASRATSRRVARSKTWTS